VSTGDPVAFALRRVRGHRIRTGLTLLGVAIGVAAVILLTALGDGARRYVMGSSRASARRCSPVVPGKTETTGAAAFMSVTTKDLTLADAEALGRRVQGVQRMAPMSMASETVAHGDRTGRSRSSAATSDFPRGAALEARARPVPAAGRLRGARRSPSSARRSPASSSRAPTRSEDDPVGRCARGHRRAGAARHAARHELDEVAIVPVARAMRLFNRRSLFRVLLDARVHADLATVKRDVIAVMRERHGEEDVTVVTQDAVMSSFGRILRALTLAVAAIAAISLAVAGIGIMNVMLVSVTERTAEVGLLRAVGAGRAQIAGVFLAEAALLSLAGGLLGLVLGSPACGARDDVPALPARPPLWAVSSALRSPRS
jgi:putative ABC transport system permease protein